MGHSLLATLSHSHHSLPTMPARLIWAILLAGTLATLFASCEGAAGKQVRKDKTLLGFLRNKNNNKRQIKLKHAKVKVSKQAKKEKTAKAKKQKKSNTNERNKLRRTNQRKSAKDSLSGKLPTQKAYTCNGT